jgi:hemolysin III
MSSQGVTPELVTQVLLRPRWRGHLHTWAFSAVFPAGLALLLAAPHGTARTGAAIYVVSLAAVYGTSAAYHRLAHSARRRRLMQRLDHSMIFLVIGGTYTPVCILALPLVWGVPLLALVWAGAALGIALKLIGLERFRRSGNALYLVLGWAALVATPVIATHLTALELAFMVAGGVTYTAGAIVLFRQRPDPWPAIFGYHEVWHCFTVVAGVAHFVMVWLVVTR